VLGIKNKQFVTSNFAKKYVSKCVHCVSCIFINFILYGLHSKYVMNPSDAVDLESPLN